MNKKIVNIHNNIIDAFKKLNEGVKENYYSGFSKMSTSIRTSIYKDFLNESEEIELSSCFCNCFIFYKDSIKHIKNIKTLDEKKEDLIDFIGDIICLKHLVNDKFYRFEDEYKHLHNFLITYIKIIINKSAELLSFLHLE